MKPNVTFEDQLYCTNCAAERVFTVDQYDQGSAATCLRCGQVIEYDDFDYELYDSQDFDETWSYDGGGYS